MNMKSPANMRTVTMLAVLFFGTACVSAGTYDEAVAKAGLLESELQTCSDARLLQYNASKNQLSKMAFELESSAERLIRQEDELATLRARNAIIERRLTAARHIMVELRDLVSAGKVQLKLRNGRMVVELPSDIVFASGSAELTADGLETLRDLGSRLAEIDRDYQIEGHTDSNPVIFGSEFKDNWELASMRAMNVVHILMLAGIPAGRLSAASFADSRPLNSNESPAGRARNRRIEIVVVPRLIPIPELEELL